MSTDSERIIRRAGENIIQEGGTVDEYIYGDRGALTSREFERIIALSPRNVAEELFSYLPAVEVALKDKDTQQAVYERFGALVDTWVGENEDAPDRQFALYLATLNLSLTHDTDEVAMMGYVLFPPSLHWEHFRHPSVHIISLFDIERKDPREDGQNDGILRFSTLIRALTYQWQGRPYKKAFISPAEFEDQEELESYIRALFRSPALPMEDKKRAAQLVAYHAQDLSQVSTDVLLYALEPAPYYGEKNENTSWVREAANEVLADQKNREEVSAIFEDVPIGDRAFWQGIALLSWMDKTHLAPTLLQHFEKTTFTVDAESFLAHEVYMNLLNRVLYPHITLPENMQAFLASITEAVHAGEKGTLLDKAVDYVTTLLYMAKDKALPFDLKADYISQSLELIANIWFEKTAGEKVPTFNRFGEIMTMVNELAESDIDFSGHYISDKFQRLIKELQK